MQVTFKSVDTEEVKKGKTPFQKAVVTFDKDGKDMKQTLVSFKNPDVFATIQKLSEGDVIDVTTTKEGDFWQWAKVEKLAGVAKPDKPTGGKVTGSNYETKEERAERQVLIVRQSSLKEAVAALGPAKNRELYTDLAQYFADWVFAKNIFTEEDDIPF